MSILSTPTEYEVCPKCGGRNFAGEENCTNCGKFMRQDRNIRIAGTFFVVVGVLLTAVSTAVSFWINGKIAENGKPDAKSGWTASSSETSIMFGIMALLLTYGLAFLAVGAWNLYTGKFNPTVSKAVLRFVWVFWLIGMIIKWLAN